MQAHPNNNELVRLLYEEKSNKIYDFFKQKMAIIDTIEKNAASYFIKTLPHSNQGLYQYNDQEFIKTIDPYDKNKYVYTAKNDNYTVQVDNTLDIITFTYQGTDKNQKIGLVGTNKELVVKYLKKEAYDGVKTEDMMNHGLVLLNACLNPVISNKIPQASQADYIKKIRELEEKFKKTIYTTPEHHLDYTKMKILINQENARYMPQTNYFETIANNVEKETIALYQALFQTYNQHATNKLDKKQFSEEISKAKMQVLKNRPNIVKFSEFALPDSKGEPDLLMSAQFTGSTIETRSSLDRMPDEKNKVSSSNHVLQVDGIRNKDNKITVDAPLTGNSSPTGLASSSTVTRRAEAIKAIQEQIARLALDAKERGAKEPIKIDLSVMILLSSYKIKLSHGVNKKVNYFNESFQLTDLRFAYDVINDLGTQTVALDGKSVEVDVDINYMNIPANKAGNKIKYQLESKIETNINNKGFYQYCANVENYFKNDLIAKKSENAQITKFVTELTSDSKISQLEKELVSLRKSTKVALNHSAEEIKKISTQYISEKNQTKKEWLKKEWEQQTAYRTRIRKQESALYQKIIDEKKRLFDTKKNQIEIKIKNLEKEINKEKDKAKKEFLLLTKRYLSNQMLFYTKGYQDIEHNYEFQNQFLLTNTKIGRFIQSYCKSGKDRTGWIRILRATYLAYNWLTGKDPGRDPNKPDPLFKIFLRFIHKASASPENTMSNSGGRGLEVSYRLTNPDDISIKLQKINATIAKRVMAKATKRSTREKLHNVKEKLLIKRQPILSTANEREKLNIIESDESDEEESLPLLTINQDSDDNSEERENDFISRTEHLLDDDEQSFTNTLIQAQNSSPLTQESKEYFKNKSFEEQFKYDHHTVAAFLRGNDSTDPTYAEKQNILRRVLTTLDRTQINVLANTDVKDKNIPLSSLLLHGSSIKIEVPYIEGKDSNAFFYALMGGQSNILPYKQGENNSENASKNNKPVFHRDPSRKDTSIQANLLHHYYGVNLGLGDKNYPLHANGHHGHLYFHWTPPTKDQSGNLIIAIHGSEPGKTNRFGELNEKNQPMPIFTASGGTRFSSSTEDYCYIDQFRTRLSPSTVTSLMNDFQSQKINKIENELEKNMPVHFINTNKIENKLNHYDNNLKQFQQVVHEMGNKPFDVSTMRLFITQINHYEKTMDELNSLNNKSSNIHIKNIKDKMHNLMAKTNNILAHYEEKHDTDDNNEAIIELQSSYNDDKNKTIIINQTIKIVATNTISSLNTESITAINQLSKLTNPEMAKILSFNEAIKWVEAALKAHCSHHLSFSQITLEHYEELDNNFLKAVIYYCRLKNYDLRLKPAAPQNVNPKEAADYQKLYQDYHAVLYDSQYQHQLNQVKNKNMTPEPALQSHPKRRQDFNNNTLH